MYTALTPQAIDLLNRLAGGMTTKDAGTSPGTPLHGPGGLAATPGQSRQIANAMIMPRGLAGTIPVRKSIDTNSIYGVLTGLTASSGSEPTAACADWPTVGQFKLCHQTFPFGRQGRQSQVLQLDRVGEIVNRGEFRDNTLWGAPATTPNSTPAPINWGQVLQTEVEKKMGELYGGYFRDYVRYTYTGNPQTTAGSAGWQQYRGLQLQVATGKRDAITGALCPAADSVVYDYNGTNVQTSGDTVYAHLANIVTNLERLREQLGFDVEWGLTMRYGAFWAMTQIWPCIYATSACNSGAVASVVRSSSLLEQTELRDRMRNGRYLLIEGKEYPVIIDDAIAETAAAGGTVGTYQSDVWFLPLKANGQPSLFWEYFDMNAEAVSAAGTMAPQGYFSTLSDGRFLLVRLSPTHTCVQVEIIERPRLILALPFLAARFQNLRYTITVHERDAFPDEPYFVNGGGTTTPLPYFYPNATGG